MSPALKISLGIWARTLLFNIILVGTYAFYEEGFTAVFGLILMSIVAFVTTLPLLIIINQLVLWTASISYSSGSRLATLGFLLILVAIAFYFVGSILGFVSGARIFTDEISRLHLFATIIAVILATRSVKTTFIKLNPDKHEEELG